MSRHGRHSRRLIGVLAPRAEQLEDRRLLSSVTGSFLSGEDPLSGDGGVPAQVSTGEGAGSSAPSTPAAIPESATPNTESPAVGTVPSVQASEDGPTAPVPVSSDHEVAPAPASAASISAVSRPVMKTVAPTATPAASSPATPASLASSSATASSASQSNAADDQTPVDDISSESTVSDASASNAGIIGNSPADGLTQSASNGGDLTGNTSPTGSAGASPATGARGASSANDPQGAAALALPGNGWTRRESLSEQEAAALLNKLASSNGVPEYLVTAAGSEPGASATADHSRSQAVSAGDTGQSEPGTLSGDASAPEPVAPSPTYADLLTNFLPIDRASLDSAIDHVLDNFDAFGSGFTDLKAIEGLALPIAAGVVIILGTEATMNRRARAERRQQRDETENPIVHPLLGLPA